MSTLRDLRALPRTVWLLGAIRLVNDAASDMIYPLVPLYLTSVLMAGPKALGLRAQTPEGAPVLSGRSRPARVQRACDFCSTTR